MVVKLKDWIAMNESKLVPRNIEGRSAKLKQNNLKLLQQETITCEDILIDENFDFAANQSKVKFINAHISFEMDHIPEWFKNIEIVNGNCFLSKLGLTSLKNSPKRINGHFWCSFNELHSLEGSPKYVEDSFSCHDNLLKSLEGCPKYIGHSFKCSSNLKNFTKQDIPKNVTIKGLFIS